MKAALVTRVNGSRESSKPNQPCWLPPVELEAVPSLVRQQFFDSVCPSDHDHLFAWVGTDGVETLGLRHGPARLIELSGDATTSVPDKETARFQEPMNLRN